MNEKFCISIQISLKLVPKRLIDNMSALVQGMARRRSGDKPLPEPLMTQSTDAYRGDELIMYAYASDNLAVIDLYDGFVILKWRAFIYTGVIMNNTL